MRSLLHKLTDVWGEFGRERVHLVSQSSNDLNLTFVVDEAVADDLLPRLHQLLIRSGAMGQNGPRIHEKLRQLSQQGHKFVLEEASEMDDAIRIGRNLLENNGLILLSPGAPSFPRYKDYAERGRHFAKVAGFDPKASSMIPGLGVA